MNEVYPPFTEYWGFTGPNVAISCEVDYDREHEEYRATTSAGFHGAGQTQEEAALACFSAWMTGKRGWFEPLKEGSNE